MKYKNEHILLFKKTKYRTTKQTKLLEYLKQDTSQSQYQNLFKIIGQNISKWLKQILILIQLFQLSIECQFWLISFLG